MPRPGRARRLDVDATAKKPPKGFDGISWHLHNGKFVDYRGVVAKEVVVDNGVISKVGKGPDGTEKKDVLKVDLKGATVIPGLIDSHVHFMRCGQNPGHEVRIIETATSIADLQQSISDRAKTVPAGEWITCIGGWNRNGLAEKRLPTAAELDAAAPNNPVYLSQTGGGAPGGVTNTAGAAFFTSKGVAVGANGTIASTGGAQAALVSVQTDADKQRGTSELMDFAASLGLTTVSDQGGINNVGLGAFKYAVALWREGELKVRQRPFFWTGDDTSPDAAAMRAHIVNNINRLGDEYFKFVGIGERIGSGDFAAAALFVAQQGWTMTQHSLTAAENNLHLSAYEAAAAVAPVGELRWSLAHVNSICDANIARVKQLGITLNVQGYQYTGAAGTTAAGPPWRKLRDAGIPLGGGTDATNVGALNPWLMLSYMTTGRNNAGDQSNAADQSLTRLEALKLYTKGSAYLLFEDDALGSSTPARPPTSSCSAATT